MLFFAVQAKIILNSDRERDVKTMSYKSEFIQFMCESNVLGFGEFTLKSGRLAPYFINTGNYRTGAQIEKLGEYYAACMQENHVSADALFGPAYKGIPLAVATAIALHNRYDVDVNYCFNRKEIKDHGEGGSMAGYPLKDGDRVAIIEDVITAGTAIRECLPVLRQAADVQVTGLVISVDRMERGKGEKSAVQEVFEEFGIKTYPLVTINDIIEAIQKGVIPFEAYLPKMIAYREKYGV